MTKQFLRRPGSIQLLDGTRKAFDSSLLPLAGIPDAAISLSNYTISWPDLTKDNGYYWEGHVVDSGHREESYAAFITAPPQEWGPSAANVISDVVLGTVPSGCEFLDVSLKINSRTHAPTDWMGDTLPTVIPVGKSMRLLGGSALFEEAAYFARGMAIVLGDDNGDGTKNVLLRRYQSVGALDNAAFVYSSGNSTTASGGFTYGISQPGQLVHFIPDGSGNGNAVITTLTSYVWQRGSSNQTTYMPLTDTTDYSSSYSVDLVITPGYFLTDPTIYAPSSRKAFRLWSGGVSTSSTSSSETFSSVPFGTPDSTRHILVVVSGYFGTTSISASSVSIGGVGATKIAESTTTACTSSIWLAAVPTGTSGNIVVNFSGNFNHNVEVAAFALYHFSSWSAVATATSNSSGSAASLATTNGGYAFAIETHFRGSDGPTMSGIPSAFRRNRLISGGAGDSAHECGFEPTDGSTLSINHTFSSVGALAAASFS